MQDFCSPFAYALDTIVGNEEKYLLTVTLLFLSDVQTVARFELAKLQATASQRNFLRHGETLLHQESLRTAPKISHKNSQLSFIACSGGTAHASLCDGLLRRCTNECVFVYHRERLCVCSSPLLDCLSGSAIWGVAKALAKWAAGHHSWFTISNTHTHTHRGKCRATR